MAEKISASLCGFTMSSPLVLASGIMGLSASSMRRVSESGAGAVTTKSFSIEERKGHPCPAIIPYEHGYLNAVGLSNPGYEEMLKEITEFTSVAPRTSIFASIFGKTVEEFGIVAEKISQKPSGIALIELNVSCPNVASEFGRPFVSDIKELEKITKTVKSKSGKIPVSVKLSLQCASLSETAKCCEASGADAITAINTVGPGMLIDINSRNPVLSNKFGGVSGPSIFPLTVKAVYEIFSAVKIPIIATGGVSSSEDAIQLILAGASAIGIGSGIHKNGLDIFSQINKKLAEYATTNELSNIFDLKGKAHA
ncbi:MAG: dihydroorotate dehydrogenase [Candidatus Riflebacteria bacterium]|nr:dihydroorotate dehydrogenase [Candidatus Riflebacteria bacterium]